MKFLTFDTVCKLTIASDGHDISMFVAMGFKETPSWNSVTSLRYLVNSPERFEQEVVGNIIKDESTGCILEKLVDDDEASSVYYQFDPLTRESFRTMGVTGYEEILADCATDEALRAYFWNDWVHDFWKNDVPSAQ